MSYSESDGEKLLSLLEIEPQYSVTSLLSFGGTEKDLGQNSHVLCLMSEYGILE